MQICNDVLRYYHKLITKECYCVYSLLLKFYSNVLNNLHTCIWVLWLYISDKNLYYACLF